MSKTYASAASACLDRLRQGQPATLAREDQLGMIRELAAAGIRTDGQGVAYLARRYDDFGENTSKAAEASAFAEKTSTKANAKSAATFDRISKHNNAARAHDHAATAQLQAGNVTQAAQHSATAEMHRKAVAQATDRPVRQAVAIKARIESKVPGSTVTIGAPNSAGTSHMTIEHAPSGAKHEHSVSQYGIAPTSVQPGSDTVIHPTTGQPVSSGRDKFEKIMKAAINKAKKIDAAMYESFEDDEEPDVDQDDDE